MFYAYQILYEMQKYTRNPKGHALPTMEPSPQGQQQP